MSGIYRIGIIEQVAIRFCFSIFCLPKTPYIRSSYALLHQPYTMKTLLFAFAIALFASCLTLSAQYLKYRQLLPPPWKVQNPLFEATDSLFIGEDAVILSEKNEWRMDDLQMTTTFKKNIAIRFLTPQGIAQYNNIVIPETNDPSRDYADLPTERRSKVHRPKYFDLELLYISARIIKPDGTVRFVSLQDSIETEPLLFNSRRYAAYAYSFRCPRVEVGDILEVQYQYFVPFLLDYRRLFFHGNLPKQQYQLNITYHPREYYVWQPQNGAIYTDSVKTNKEVRLTWRYQNLPGCMNEPNAQPHNDLPHLQYYIHNKNYGTWSDIALTDYLPYTWKYYTHDWVGFRSSVQYKHTTKLNRKEVALNQFYRQYADTTTTSHPLRSWANLQRVLNNDFSYYAQSDAFANLDPRLGHLSRLYMRRLLRNVHRGYVYHGIFDRLDEDPTLQLTVEADRDIAENQLENIPLALSRQKLKNINIESIYTGLLNRIGEPYYRVLLNDRRIAALHAEQCQPLWGENRLLAMHTQNQVFYITPKTRRFGYHINELPFYLENVPSVHIAQLTDSYNSPNVLEFYGTPQSTAADNLRTTDVLMKLKLNDREARCEARIVLSGQYSTLIRENYQYGSRDSSINQQYYLRPSQLSQRSTAAAPVIEKQEEQFPYRTQIKLAYNDNALLEHPNDSTYTLSLRNWVQHVIVEPLNSNKQQQRYLPYYTDFQGSDIFRYQIVFDQPIRLVPVDGCPIHIKNKFGMYDLTIAQTTPTTIVLHAELITQTDRIAPEQITDVRQIYDAVHEIGKQKIIVIFSK